MRRAANYTTMQRVAHDQGIILGHNTINAYCSTATDAQRSCCAYVFKLLYLSGRLSCHCALLHESSNNFSLYIINEAATTTFLAAENASRCSLYYNNAASCSECSIGVPPQILKNARRCRNAPLRRLL